MKSSWIHTIWFAAFAFIGGVLADRGGYVPIESESLFLGMFLTPLIIGVPIVGYVLFMVFVWDKRKERQRAKSK